MPAPRHPHYGRSKRTDHKRRYYATRRLPCELAKDSFSYHAYAADSIYERHRHRYEFNNQYRDTLSEKGMRIAGTNPERDLVEIVEIPDHPWFVAVQFHPEFKSKPCSPPTVR